MRPQLPCGAEAASLSFQPLTCPHTWLDPTRSAKLELLSTPQMQRTEAQRWITGQPCSTGAKTNPWACPLPAGVFLPCFPDVDAEGEMALTLAGTNLT